MRKTAILFILLSLIFYISCNKDNPVEITDVTFNSPESTPEEQGMDSGKLLEAYKKFANYAGSYSLLVMRNGYIVAEQYFRGQTQNSYLSVRSVAKSFISILIGIAIKEKFIDSVSQSIADFFPEHFENNRNEEKKYIQIKNLLSMTAGLEVVEGTMYDWLEIVDVAGYMLSRMMIANPGTKFLYDTPLNHMLSIIITRSSKMSTYDFAQKYLFEPTGIKIEKWTKDKLGYYVGGVEMYFTPRNLMKFGKLILNKGKWDGKQVIPENWIKEASTPFITANIKTSYGYCFWINYTSGVKAFYAVGMGGQYIYIVPDFNLVVVATASVENLPGDENLWRISDDFFPEFIYPAIKK